MISLTLGDMLRRRAARVPDGVTLAPGEKLLAVAEGPGTVLAATTRRLTLLQREGDCGLSPDSNGSSGVSMWRKASIFAFIQSTRSNAAGLPTPSGSETPIYAETSGIQVSLSFR